MVCWLVRHGKDDDTIRGGWSDHALLPEGIEQVKQLGSEMRKQNQKVGRIYASDLRRAKETALILQTYLQCPVEFLPEFREANNGVLAGMKHELANERYPGIYWSALDESECYPGGESPRQFFLRIRDAWEAFLKTALREEADAVILVTHGGVMEVILCLENGIPYTNRKKQFQTPAAVPVPVEI